MCCIFYQAGRSGKRIFFKKDMFRMEVDPPEDRSNRLEVFLEKGVLKICSRFAGKHPCRSVILIKLLCNFIEIALRYGCSPVNLLHIFRTPFLKKTSGRLVLIGEYAKNERCCLVNSLNIY